MAHKQNILGIYKRGKRNEVGANNEDIREKDGGQKGQQILDNPIGCKVFCEYPIPVGVTIEDFHIMLDIHRDGELTSLHMLT